MNQERFLKIGALISGLALLLSGIYLAMRPKPVDLPDYFAAPGFILTDQHGMGFDSESLKGKVWAASFIYTTCKSSCPMLAAQMLRLSDGMPKNSAFAMLSFSVDPEHDTPERLAAYAKGLGIKDERWLFLTGAKPYIKKLVVEGFKLPAEPGVKSGEGEILHSSYIVLVDAKGRIRGYYDGVLSETSAKIKHDAELLIEAAR